MPNDYTHELLKFGRSDARFAGTMLAEVREGNFDQIVIAASRQRPVLVDFWAPWCGPCRMLGPVLEQLAGELAGRVDIVKLNTDDEPALAQSFQIRSIPAVKLFQDGKVVAEFVGAQPAGAIKAWLEPYLAPAADDPLTIAEQHLAAGAALEATRLLDALPADRQSSDRARTLYARAHFVALAQADPAGSMDLAVRVAAARATVVQDYGAAIARLLDHMATSVRFARAEGRTDLLRVLELAGPSHPDTAAARRRLATLLN